MTKLCSICKKEIDSENASILAMGGFGNPKYICDECSSELDVAMRGREYGEIMEAISSISNKIMNGSTDDSLVVETLEYIFSDSKSRAEKIKNGEYNFEDDERESDEILDVPEELRETEEDKRLDEEDRIEQEKLAEVARKTDLFVAGLILGAAIIGAIVYFVIPKLF